MDQKTKRAMETHERKAVIHEAVKTIIDKLNVLSLEIEHEVEDAILEQVVNSHRTLQASFWRAIFNTAKKYGKLDKSIYTDLRNEAAWEACQELSKTDIYIPTI